MIPISKDFYDCLQRGELPEILCLLDSSAGSRWVFGKTRPSIATSSYNSWDGSRLYGEGTYGGDLGLISAEAQVLTYGSIKASIAYSSKDVMMSLTQVEIGSMQVVMDNASGFFSDLLGEDKAVSFLNFALQIVCGFPSIDFSAYIELFSGTVTEEHLTGQTLKLLAQGNTPGLLEVFTLPRASRYTSPRSPNDILPFVYGDTAENSVQGVSVCPCIDTANNVHLLACHALPSGASVALYADAELITSGYTITLSGDYEGQGTIAYATFTTAQTATITMTTTAGKGDLTNPVDVLEDILTEAGDTTAHNTASWTRARVDAEALSYTAAGIVAADQPPSFWMTDILSSFLGSWYLNNSQEIVISFDSSRLQPGAVSGILRERDASKISGMRTRQNVCNQLFVSYAYSVADVDRRFKDNANPSFLSSDDGDNTKDSISQAKYGVMQKRIDLKWCRNSDTVSDIQDRVVGRYADPVWMVHFPEQVFRNLTVEPGDFVTYSWEDQQDSTGGPVKNQIARVLSIERDLDLLTCTFELSDFGEWFTTTPAIWDGSVLYGVGTYGNNRDRRDL